MRNPYRASKNTNSPGINSAPFDHLKTETFSCAGSKARKIRRIQISVKNRTDAGTGLALESEQTTEGQTMEILQEPTAEAVLQLQQMLETPIEDQAALYELNLLGSLLGNGVQLLKTAESEEETCDVLRQMIKSAFVIGRRHVNQLV
ncbi:MAG TPA: hypothetical protein VHV54_12145 [Candidatus Binatia bacterium]|nr:hypothetical protein [Candidatus Binatia bacterium]